MFKTFSLFFVYICCLHSILVLYVINYGINKIYFTNFKASFVETAGMQMCKLLCHNCVQYICLLAHFFGKRDDNTANI